MVGPLDHDGWVKSIYFFDPNGARLELTTVTGAHLEADYRANARADRSDLETWRLRSVELELPDVARPQISSAAPGDWFPPARRAARKFFRGTGTHPYILSITKASSPAVAAITFSGPADEIQRTDRTFDVPGGGKGFEIRGPEAQTYRFIIENELVKPLMDRDKPIQLTHAVLNTADQDASERFAVEKLGFIVSDRTAHMRFLRCNRKHHCVAYAKSALPSLNHTCSR